MWSAVENMDVINEEQDIKERWSDAGRCVTADQPNRKGLMNMNQTICPTRGEAATYRKLVTTDEINTWQTAIFVVEITLIMRTQQRQTGSLTSYLCLLSFSQWSYLIASRFCSHSHSSFAFSLTNTIQKPNLQWKVLMKITHCFCSRKNPGCIFSLEPHFHQLCTSRARCFVMKWSHSLTHW